MISGPMPSPGSRITRGAIGVGHGIGCTPPGSASDASRWRAIRELPADPENQGLDQVRLAARARVQHHQLDRGAGVVAQQ